MGAKPRCKVDETIKDISKVALGRVSMFGEIRGVKVNYQVKKWNKST